MAEADLQKAMEIDARKHPTAKFLKPMPIIPQSNKQAAQVVKNSNDMYPRSHSMQNESPRFSKFWQPMTSNGQFIILMMADAFLTHEYEYCLRIGKCDFSYISNSSLFESNLLRFVSMASAKQFEHAMRV